jgi:hypothetical protein
LKTKFIYVIFSTALITTLTFLLSHFYTSQYYILLLYIGYLVILASFTMVLVNTDSKPVVLLAVLVTFILLRMLPRLPNFSGYALAPGDEGYDLSTALITLHNGHLVYEKINGHNVEYINYPMLHIFTSVFTQIAGVDPIVTLVALPQIISATILLLFVSSTSYSEVNKFKLSLILVATFLLAGVHAQYWSTLVREAYVSLFSTLILLNTFTMFVDNTSVMKIPILILTSVALVFSHYATNVYTISAIVLMLLLVQFLMKYSKSSGVFGKEIRRCNYFNYLLF